MLVKEKNYRKLFSHFWNLILIKITMSTKTAITIMWQLLKLSFQDKLQYVEQSEWTGVFLQKWKTNQSLKRGKTTFRSRVKFFFNPGGILVLSTWFPQFTIQQWLMFHGEMKKFWKKLFVFFSIICSWRVLIGQISTCLIIHTFKHY